ncbi:MAG: type III polyketide synthase [Geminicoccaceae bacterium]|nr:type III polyketide synthase [Geminicoccaceae bacterium]
MEGNPLLTAPAQAALLSLATASPPNVLRQDEVAARAKAIFGARFAVFERLFGVFANAGIEERRSVRPFAWFEGEQGWPSRTAAFLEGADALFVDAARRALDAAGLAPEDVDTVVTVSSTGIATPSLEARAAAVLGFRPDARRVPVFGLGCAGGVTGLALGARLAAAEPGSVVLVVVIELCTLSFRMDKLTKENVVATALFGDGAAAAVLRTGEGLARVEGAGEHTWPDTLDVMGWSVEPEGFGVIFAQSIPPFVEERLRDAVDGILGRLGLRRADVARFVCHPGGSKVVRALETALGLDEGVLDHERDVLRAHGNMSSPTVLFVLERVLKEGLPGRAVLTALGPGFTASALALTPP